MTSSPTPGIKATADLMRKLYTALGRGSAYRLHATKPLSGESVYRIRLSTPFEKLDLPIVEAPLAVSFQRPVLFTGGKAPYKGVTLGHGEQLRNDKKECQLLQIRSNVDTIDLHLKAIPNLQNDGGQPWLLMLDFHDPPAMAVAKPSDAEF